MENVSTLEVGCDKYVGGTLIIEPQYGYGRVAGSQIVGEGCEIKAKATSTICPQLANHTSTRWGQIADAACCKSTNIGNLTPATLPFVVQN